jgi:four helix bundle protein
MAKGDDIQERLINFAVDIIEITSKLPKTIAGKHIAGQLLRSGTSPAPNYAEARGSESTNDFVHKLKIALKELNESNVWLEISKRSKMLNEFDLNRLFAETGELRNIIAASIVTALKNEKRRPHILSNM